jgi:hypothetical protein
MEWLFLSSHNHWIVCRLVKDDTNPFLAYSPMISIEGSSEPFRAFFGAILSVIKGVPVSPSTRDPEMKLDTIIEDQDQDTGPLRENDLDDGSGAYRGNSSKGTGTKTRTSSRLANRLGNRAQDEGDESGLMVCPFLRYHLSR